VLEVLLQMVVNPGLMNPGSISLLDSVSLQVHEGFIFGLAPERTWVRIVIFCFFRNIPNFLWLSPPFVIA
jgi:hypothetical protein